MTRTLFLLAMGAAMTGCGGVVVFEGKGAMEVDGTVAAPPRIINNAVTHAVLQGNQIVIDQKVQFEQSKAVILPESFGLLDEVADVIKKHPEIKKLEVGGHASSEGDPKVNQTLSDARAASVMAYLVNKGVEPARLSSKGYGASKPIADNATEDGRIKNRRVEFVVLESDKK